MSRQAAEPTGLSGLARAAGSWLRRPRTRSCGRRRLESVPHRRGTEPQGPALGVCVGEGVQHAGDDAPEVGAGPGHVEQGDAFGFRTHGVADQPQVGADEAP